MSQIFHYAAAEDIATITWDLRDASMNVQDEEEHRQRRAYLQK